MRVGGDGWTRPLGKTGLNVTAVAVGGGPLGSMPELFGYVAAEQAIDLVRATLASPIRVLDTSNGYSGGDSERRIGEAITRFGGLPADYLVVTKVDPQGEDYSGARVRASVQESKQRLGLDVLPLVHLHDPEFHDQRDLMGPGGAVEALVKLRDDGEIGHIGVAGGDVRVLSRYLDLGVFDAVLVHNRFTLVDRGAGDVFDRATAEGLGVFNAAIYGGGILADPHAGLSTYAYRPATSATLDAVARMAAACERYGSTLATAALQVSLRDSRIHATIVGLRDLSQLTPTLAAADADLPAELWDELASLTPAPENWLDHEPSFP